MKTDMNYADIKESQLILSNRMAELKMAASKHRVSQCLLSENNKYLFFDKILQQIVKNSYHQKMISSAIFSHAVIYLVKLFQLQSSNEAMRDESGNGGQHQTTNREQKDITRQLAQVGTSWLFLKSSNCIGCIGGAMVQHTQLQWQGFESKFHLRPVEFFSVQSFPHSPN